jgi:hypothetical protein
VLEDAALLSDIRVKTGIRRSGTTVHGLPLYEFGYRNAEGRYEGVMAQDVLEVLPAAVSRGEDGFYRVNYEALSIEMRRLK